MNIRTSFRKRLERVSSSSFVVFALCCGCQPTPPPRTELIRPVKTMLVAAGEDVRIRSFPGTVEASRRVELAFQVSGLLVDFPVKEGQEVKKGDLIGQVRKDEFEARLNALQGQLDQARAELVALRLGERPEERLRRESQVRAAQARLANVRTERDRLAPLVPRGAISRSEFELAETQYQIAIEELSAAQQLVEKGLVGREEDILAKEAQIRGLEGRVVEANIQVNDCTLTAPFDGVIAQRFVEQGQNVRAKEPIVRFQDADEVEIAVDVPEAVMATDIRRADILKMVAEISGLPGMTFPVRIREIAQVADPTVQTFNVRVAMPAPTEVRVLPGMTATVTVDYRRANVLGQRILVPISAVYERSNGKQVVWLISKDNEAKSRPVEVGSVQGGDIEITKGLEPGDRIAVAGVSFLRDGMKVRDLGDALGGSP
jgi:RND family efflux transporter MFP subunit